MTHRPGVRHAAPLLAALASGCLLFTGFDDYGTTAHERVLDGGIVETAVTLSVGPSAVRVRPDVPATVPVTVRRTGGAPAPVTVRLVNLPTGLAANELVLAPDTSYGALTVSASDIDAFAAREGTSVSVLVSATDAGGATSGPSSITIDLWGRPGDPDPTRPTAAVVFDSDSAGYMDFGRLPSHVGDFVGSTLAVASYQSLVMVDETGAATRVTLDAAPWESQGSDTALASGNVLNVATVKYDGGVTTLRGRLDALVAAPAVGETGYYARCLVDGDGLRLVCGHAVSGGYRSTLSTLEGPARGAMLRTLDQTFVSGILHTPRGWLLVETDLPRPLAFSGGRLSLLDDLGAPVAGFASAASGALFTDAVTDDTGIVVGGADTDGRALVERRNWTGDLETWFAEGGRLYVEGGVTLQLSSSTAGVLAAACDGQPEPSPNGRGVTRITRFDAKTGVIDRRFGEHGTATLDGTGAPIAIREVKDRIFVASLTATGAEVRVLFP